MAVFRETTVEVRRREDGVVQVGASRPAGVLTQSIALDNGTLTVDLDNMNAAPYAEIEDARLASWWVSFVLGEDVHDAILSASEDLTRTEAVARPGALSNAVLRFGVGLWLYRWWPSSDRAGVPELTLDGERWLETELGVLAWYAAEAFGGNGVAESFLAQNIAFIGDLLLSSAGTRRPLAVVRAAIESVPLSEGPYQRLSNLEDAILESSRAAAEQDWAGAQSWLARARSLVTGMRHDLALVLGGDSFAFRGGEEAVPGRGYDAEAQVLKADKATVEWGRVRARALGAAEANVTWRVIPHDGDSVAIQVEVPVGDRWNDDVDVIHAAVFIGGDSFPAEIVRLGVNDADGTRLIGTGALDAEADLRALAIRIFGEEDFVSDGKVASTEEEREAVVAKITQLHAAAHDPAADVPAYEVELAEAWPVPDTV